MKSRHLQGFAALAALSVLAGCAAMRGDDDAGDRYGNDRYGSDRYRRERRSRDEYRTDIAPTTRSFDGGDERTADGSSNVSSSVVPGPTSVIQSPTHTPDWVRSGTTATAATAGVTSGTRTDGTAADGTVADGADGTVADGSRQPGMQNGDRNGTGGGAGGNGFENGGRDGTDTGTGFGTGVGTGDRSGAGTETGVGAGARTGAGLPADGGGAGRGTQPGTRSTDTTTTPAAGTSTKEAGGNRVANVAPDFTLRDTNGQEHRLSEHAGKVVVLEWTNPACPFVKRHYENGAMQALQKRYTGQGVVWLAVSSVGEGTEGFRTNDAWNTSIRDNGSSASAVLLDPKGEVGRLYGAKTTPHVFVVAQDGRIAYQGAVDDKATTESDKAEGARNYLTEALDAVLSGKPVPLGETTPYGCPIRFAADAGAAGTRNGTDK
jgi:peroxiredoxin